MVHPNLNLQSDWTNDEKILRYTVYNVNGEMMQQWSEDVLTALRHWEITANPRILFDVSYPNVSMSYFVLSHREIFNMGITPQGKQRFLKFLENNAHVHIKLAVVLSKTMLGALSKYVPTTYQRDNYKAKIFFERDAAEQWLRVDPGEDAFNTNSVTSATLIKVIQELENQDPDIYGDRDYLQFLVNDNNLEMVPIINGQPIIVGRNSRADLDLSSFGALARSVSRRHAQISLSNGRLSVIDLDSRNGTYISDQRIEAGKTVFIGRDDVIRVGNIELQVIF